MSEIPSKSISRTLLVICCMALSVAASSQMKIIRGIVKDVHSDERIPFASLQFNRSGSGKLTDSAGNFAIGLEAWPKDTLVVTYVGYQDYIIPIDSAFLAKEKDNAVVL